MVALVVALAVGVVVLLVVVVLVGRGRAAAVARAEELDATLATTRAELAAAEADRDRERDRAVAAEHRATTQQQLASAARAEAQAEQVRAAEAEERATVADELASSAATRAGAAEQHLAHLRRALDPPGLWAFERERLCRLWRDWVSVTLDDGCPLPAEPGPALGAAVEVLASASREECGVPIDVSWGLDAADRAVMGVESVLVVLRAVEELIAAARGTDGAGLVIDRAGDELELRLTPDAPRVVPAGLASASADVGWQLSTDGDALVLRVPTAPTTASVPQG